LKQPDFAGIIVGSYGKKRNFFPPEFPEFKIKFLLGV
jgi:hypothetical protein